ncbi:MAG: glycerol-3-phosphate dehydrogenase, partial [Bacillota bacterium]|nr:glycerol-3-phosphate dehydrogenase [Bacillota bacterium]
MSIKLYDFLGKRTVLPRSHALNLTDTQYGAPLKSTYTRGFIYPDCWVDDARLVIANAMAAQENGAKISPYCKITKLTRT